jgi:hypothetical protein
VSFKSHVIWSCLMKIICQLLTNRFVLLCVRSDMCLVVLKLFWAMQCISLQ